MNILIRLILFSNNSKQLFIGVISVSKNRNKARKLLDLKEGEDGESNSKRVFSVSQNLDNRYKSALIGYLSQIKTTWTKLALNEKLAFRSD